MYLPGTIPNINLNNQRNAYLFYIKIPGYTTIRFMPGH
jgi:hypothetical protein